MYIYLIAYEINGKNYLMIYIFFLILDKLNKVQYFIIMVDFSSEIEDKNHIKFFPSLEMLRYSFDLKRLH